MQRLRVSVAVRPIYGSLGCVEKVQLGRGSSVCQLAAVSY